MLSSNLIRLAALAAVASGVLFVIADSLILAEDPDDPIGSVTSVSYAVSVGLALLGGVLLTGGLVGVYVSRSEALGSLGLVGFVLAFAGHVLATGGIWDQAFVVPVLAQESPELLLTGPPGLVAFGQILYFGLLTLGWLILGAAILRAQAYPRAAAVLAMVGVVVQALPGSTIIGVAGGLAFDAAIAWLGLALLTGRRAQPEQRPQRVR